MFSIVSVCLAAALYLLFFKYRVKKTSQYFWLILSAGVCIYYIFTLRKHPEEAFHFIEYGLLAYLFFRALSARIHDNTIYITSLVLVALVGAFDEFVQWLMPGRFWDYRDVGINSIAGIVVLVAIWGAVRPGAITGPVRRYSLKVFAFALTLNLIFLGLCLSNTPDVVMRYASPPSALQWLLKEEPMTEYAYKHSDPDIGYFYSRLTIEELREIDGGSASGGKNADPGSVEKAKECELNTEHTPYTNPFLFEFFVHVVRRYEKIRDAKEAGSADERLMLTGEAYREHLLLEKYFGSTLNSYPKLQLSLETENEIIENGPKWDGLYASKAGKVISFIGPGAAWALIAAILLIAWVPVGLNRKRD